MSSEHADGERRRPGSIGRCPKNASHPRPFPTPPSRPGLLFGARRLVERQKQKMPKTNCRRLGHHHVDEEEERDRADGLRHVGPVGGRRRQRRGRADAVLAATDDERDDDAGQHRPSAGLFLATLLRRAKSKTEGWRRKGLGRGRVFFFFLGAFRPARAARRSPSARSDDIKKNDARPRRPAPR